MRRRNAVVLLTFNALGLRQVDAVSDVLRQVDDVRSPGQSRHLTAKPRLPVLTQIDAWPLTAKAQQPLLTHR